ncbi:MAG: TIR domain-containing protein [Rhodomicrobium sp.]
MKPHIQYDIFISYSQRDRVAATRLQAAFEARKLKVWRDERLAGNPAQDAAGGIGTALEHSARVVVLWSRDSVNSAWVAAEAEKARRAEKIVPLALEPIGVLLPFIPRPFNMLPTADASAPVLDLPPILRALGVEQAEGQPDGVLSFATANVDISRLPDTYAEKLYGRGTEMAELLKAWDEGHTRIFAFDATGGVGKTALVYRFVEALKACGWRSVRQAFAWSFYNQGSNREQETSADDFFKAAFAHFSGGGKEPPRDPYRKGVDLACLVQAQRTLLILDGLEPLQYAAHGGPQSSTQAGSIKDPGVKALLKALADDNPGLCIVTSRIKLAELAGAGDAVFRELGEIPLMPAIELLRDLGVEPSTPPATHTLPAASEFASLTPPYTLPAAYAPGDSALPAMPAAVAKDLIEAVKELKGNALALTLAGRYLAQYYKGDSRAIREISDLPQPGPGGENEPYRVMRAVEIALASSIPWQDASEKPASEAAGRQLALLFFLGLFDRPVERELLAVVFSEAAADLKSADTDLATAQIDPVPIRRRLYALDEELNGGSTPEWRRQQIEQLKHPLIAAQRGVIEARCRVLVRRLFAGVHTVMGDGHKIAEALSQLASQGLVARGSKSRASIDCHPLVRGYFGVRLKELDGEVFRAAHERLYGHYRYAGLPAAFRRTVPYAALALKAAYKSDHYQNFKQRLLDRSLSERWLESFAPVLTSLSDAELATAFALVDGPDWERARAAYLPEDEAGMTPLFAAIAHGCAAEREEETFNEVYLPRIRRGNDDFAGKTLGLSGPELSAIASFFETPFAAPSPRLAAGERALVQNLAGSRLRALGRLEEAVAPMHATIDAYAQLSDWGQASLNAGNLSELLLLTGQLHGEEGAVAAGERAVSFADRSGDTFKRTAARASNLGAALLQEGALARAEAIFREAEALQKEGQPDLPRLYSLRGFHYCGLLLARGRAAEADARAKWASEAFGNETKVSALTAAFAGLTEARAAMAGVPASASAPQNCAIRAKEALAVLRGTSQEVYTVLGLLAYAEALWRSGDANAAGEPLREAEAIAKRGPMPLFLADAHLLAARIQLCGGRSARARTYRDQAATLIEKHGYGRAAAELAVLDAEIACADKAEDREAAIAAAFEAVRGEPYRDGRTGMAIDGGWWGLLPRLEALLPADAPELVSLRAAHGAYNDERDTYLAAQEENPGEEEDSEPPDPGELVEHILADQDARATIELVLEQKGIEEPLDVMKPEERRDAIAEAMFAVIAEKLALKAKTAAADPREVPDALVNRVFANGHAQGLIRDVMRQYNLDGAAADLPFETKRFITGKLKEHGFVKDEEPPPPPPPPPAKKRSWWPFAGE